MFILEKPKVGKSTLQWMLLNMVDPTLSVWVQTWWDCMYFGRTALVLWTIVSLHWMFVIKYSYFDCYCKLNICTLYVYSCIPLLCVFFNHRCIYFACLTFTRIKMCVFHPSIYLLCVFDFHWNQIVCFPISSLITLCVYHWKWLLCMFEKNCPPLWMFEIADSFEFEIADSIINI